MIFFLIMLGGYIGFILLEMVLNRFIGSENMGLDIKNNILSVMVNELCRFQDLSTM